MTTLSHKLRLLGGLLSGGRAWTGPVTVMVDVTRRCNLRCPGCRYHSPHIGRPSPGDQGVDHFSPTLFETLCDQLERAGTREIILTGDGEPSLNPGLLRIVSTLGRSRLHSTLFTNGTLLDEDAVRWLIDAGLDVLTVSLWAGSQEDYARNYPASDPGLFEVVVDNLKRISRIKAEQGSPRPTLRLYQPLNRNNFRNVEGMVDLARDSGCNELHFTPFRSRRGRLNFLALSPDERASLKTTLKGMKSRLTSLQIGTNVDKVLYRYRIGESAWERTPCYVGWVQAHVKPDGSVFPCNSSDLPMGRLEEASFLQIWNGPTFQRFRQGMLSRNWRHEMEGQLDCGFCGQLPNNERIHRVFRWLKPFRRGGDV